MAKVPTTLLTCFCGMFLSFGLDGCSRENASHTQATSARVEARPLRSGVFGGGPLYNQARTVVPQLRASGFQMVMLWTLHVNANSDLVYNDKLLVSGGTFVGDAKWPELINSLKDQPTSVDRVELSIGAGSVPDFERIKTIIDHEPRLMDSMLYKNFRALREALPVIDAISYDDESSYDGPSTLALTNMLGSLGFKVTLTPYENAEFWQTLYAQANEAQDRLIDRVYLQAYAGGTGNVPASWNAFFPGLKVDVGLWSKHGDRCESGSDPIAVRKKLSKWQETIAGGWLWLLDDMLQCAAKYPLTDYAEAFRLNLRSL